jgi:hypothetical protein
VCFTVPTGPYRERRGMRDRMKVVFPDPETPVTWITFIGTLQGWYFTATR